MVAVIGAFAFVHPPALVDTTDVFAKTEENYDLYIIEGESLTDIVHQFRQLVGRRYIPPKWAFGNAQSRWSYMNEDEVREVVAKMCIRDRPCLDPPEVRHPHELGHEVCG